MAKSPVDDDVQVMRRVISGYAGSGARSPNRQLGNQPGGTN
jgi:hypothetical protein